MASKPSPDAKLISQMTDGSTLVCRWLVMDTKDDGSTDFLVHYQINLTKLVSTYERNSVELESLHNFLDSLAKSDHKQIKNIDVIGYSSPDGNAVQNKRLATNRAVDFRSYINKHYALDDVPGETDGVALTWSDLKDAVSKSNIPSRAEVLSLISSNRSSSEIEQGLKNIPQAWDYLTRNILPNMRYVDMHVTYNSWSEVVTYTSIEPTVYYFLITKDDPSDIKLFENESSYPLDFDCCNRRCRDDDRYKYKTRSSSRKYRAKMWYR